MVKIKIISLIIGQSFFFFDWTSLLRRRRVNSEDFVLDVNTWIRSRLVISKKDGSNSAHVLDTT